MELVNAIVGKILEFTVGPIGRQLGYLTSYHDNVKKLKDELKELQNRREAVQHLVDAARRNGEEIESEVQDWLAKIDEIIVMTEKFNREENHANTRCSFKSCPNLWLRHQLSKKANKMAQEVVDVKGKGTFNKVSFYKPPETLGLPSTSSSIVNEGMESRLSIINQVLKELADPNINMVGLCGLPGVGKTTLAKEVARKAKDQNLFATVVWVTVAQSPVLKEIQTQIADIVGKKLDFESVQARASHLESRLKQENNLLVVLDDLWQRLDFHEVGIPFDYNPEKTIPLASQSGENKERRKCKILLTSRNEELLSIQMNCTRVIRVGLMSETESWKLFKKKAELPDDADHSAALFSVVTEVFQQCGQLPLAIVVVATAMKNITSPEKWRDALEQLKNPLRRNLTGMKEMDSSLQFSYNHLDGERQSIFLLSAMLSHDPLITDLLMYSMGLELLQGIYSMEKAQDALDVLISKLKASSLLLDSFSNNHFTMHDVVREFALSIAYKEQHSRVVRHDEHYDLLSKTDLEGYSRLCLDKCDITELQELHCPRLEFFLLNSEDRDLKIPSTFFKSMNELKVISFTNIKLLSLPSLSLQKKLRTLCLNSCVLKDITEVQHLKNLTALSLAYSNIEQLPSEMAQLTSLQMLNLSHCSNLDVIPPNILSSLKRLEILYMRDSFCSWVAEGSSEVNKMASLGELKHLPRLSSLEIEIPYASVLPKDLFLENSLTRYKISIGSYLGRSGEHETSKTLKLNFTSSFHLERGVQKLLERVEDLYLYDIRDRGIQNVLCDMNGEGLINLKHLRIEDSNQIENVINSTGLDVAFPILETLNLIRLPGLKNLCQGRSKSTFFCNLRGIRVVKCDQLKSIFSNLMAGCFVHLVKVEVAKCRFIKGIVTSANQDNFEQNIDMNVIIFNQLQSLKMDGLPTLTDFYFEENATTNKSNSICKSVFSNKVSFPQLEALTLSSINSSIRSIWLDDQLPNHSFSNLKTLIVKSCGFVEKLIPFHILRCLMNLEEVEVASCDLLEMVFDLNELNSSYEETLVVPLKKLTLRWLPNLKRVWSKDPQKMISFSSLQDISANSCESLTSFLPVSMASDMAHLEKLEIYSCGIHTIVANDQVSKSESSRFVFPNLTLLDLRHLPNMRSFGQQRNQMQCPRLQELIIRNCDELKMFQEEISILQEEDALGTYHSLFDDQVIPQVKLLSLESKQLSLFMQYGGLFKRFPNLMMLEVQKWSKLSGWQDPDVLLCKELLGIHAPQFTLLQSLTISGLKKVKHVWNMHSPKHSLQNLLNLEVSNCNNLVNLGPSFIRLGNLTSIHVERCHGLIYLLTSSTATTLAHLKLLRIKNCRNIKEIITKQTTEDVEEDIVFNKLEHLVFLELPSLERFCGHSFTFRFPSLKKLIIRYFLLRMFCPAGDVHTPLLNCVTFGWPDQKWETNLETTVQLHFIQQVRSMKLDEYIEMRNRWNEKLPPHISFGNLAELEVNNCDLLSEYVIPSHLVRSLSNIKRLKVHNCNSVRTVFDLQGINMDEETVNDDGESRKLLPQAMVELRYLMLRNLPNLNSVWVKDPGGFISFQNLRVMHACECGSLRYIFPASVAKGLELLRELVVESCGLLEVIVAEDENSEASPPSFVFPRLEYLKLVKLPNLKSFFPRGYTSEWSQLEFLIVSQCENLAVYGPPMASITSSSEKNIGVETQQPLFLAEKIIPKLKEIVLNEKDGIMISKGQFQVDHFRKVITLHLESFLDESATSPYSFLKRFPNLYELHVESSSFEEILPSQTQIDDDMVNIPPIKKLVLNSLNRLKKIWNVDSQLQPIYHQDLQVLVVERCPVLIKLAPSCSFENMTHLKVSGCHQLIYLVTDLTAKSLVNLRELEIINCEKVEEVVANGNEVVEGGITLISLRELRLIGLPSLKRFCSQNHTFYFKNLTSTTIIGCLQMKIFCPGILGTPRLEGVKIEENLDEERWEGDLNKTIESLFLAKNISNSK